MRHEITNYPYSYLWLDVTFSRLSQTIARKPQLKYINDSLHSITWLLRKNDKFLWSLTAFSSLSSDFSLLALTCCLLRMESTIDSDSTDTKCECIKTFDACGRADSIFGIGSPLAWTGSPKEPNFRRTQPAGGRRGIRSTAYEEENIELNHVTYRKLKSWL